MEDDAQAFIDELERKHQGPITWRTYATWYGNNHDILREFGVFLYRCNGSFFYEDFERTPSMFGFTLKTKKKSEPFKKYEGSFAIKDIDTTMQVTKQQALKVAQGYATAKIIGKASTFDKIFRQMVEMVTLKDGAVHFFELIDRKSFVAELQK